MFCALASFGSPISRALCGVLFSLPEPMCLLISDRHMGSGNEIDKMAEALATTSEEWPKRFPAFKFEEDNC